jgi:hypothetical protein
VNTQTTLSVILIILLISGCVSENGLEFRFSVNETGDVLDGGLFVNNKSLGFTDSGKISFSRDMLTNLTNFTFKTNYKGNSYSIHYDFYTEDLEYDYIDFIVSKETLEKRYITFRFYDTKTNCSLGGELYVDNIYFDNVENGNLDLSYSNYSTHFTKESEIQIIGFTDKCFGDDTNLLFTDFWEVGDIDDYFGYDHIIDFETKVLPRYPSYSIEMQGFIRPYETKEYLEDIKTFLSNNTIDNLDIISKYRIRYRYDSIMFDTEEYWQTPAETLKRGHGDCEDWATTILSIIREYDPSLNCYNTIWQSHVSIFCYIDNSLLIYDQDETRFKTSLSPNNNNDPLVDQENKIIIRKMLNSYFDYFGLDIDDQKLHAIMNENEIVEFDKNEEFVEWVYDLVID